MNLLEINHLQKIFNENRPNQVEALKDISLNVETGDFPKYYDSLIGGVK